MGCVHYVEGNIEITASSHSESAAYTDSLVNEVPPDFDYFSYLFCPFVDLLHDGLEDLLGFYGLMGFTGFEGFVGSSGSVVSSGMVGSSGSVGSVGSDGSTGVSGLSLS